MFLEANWIENKILWTNLSPVNRRSLDVKSQAWKALVNRS